MTDLGLYLAKRSVNKAEISRRSGISKQRISELTLNETSKVTALELYKIALSINVPPGDLLNELYKDITLPTE
ncbi:helix-turn-helix domain-containing protein [Mucilaginibacter lappiensis]|uniref:helix-turn-helix domain-containing protein n=1 Tax=Mucilaginibacter lappiensis TaxID=354630 RepID=UPI003D24BFAC